MHRMGRMVGLAGKAGLMRADVGNVGSRAGDGAVARLQKQRSASAKLEALQQRCSAASHLGEMPGGRMLHGRRVLRAPVARAVLRSVRAGNPLLARRSVCCNSVVYDGGLGGGGFLHRGPHLSIESSGRHMLQAKSAAGKEEKRVPPRKFSTDE
jgi:hypothetical protein